MQRERSMDRERELQKQPVSYTVEQLVAFNPYNPDILPDLENYVHEQVVSETYSLDANLCLLRLYQFEPARMSVQIVARILVKAYAIHVLSLTYQKVPRHVLAEAINVESLSLDKYLELKTANEGWSLEKGGHGKGQLIVLPPNEYNHPELRKNMADSIPLEHVARLFPVLT